MIIAIFVVYLHRLLESPMDISRHQDTTMKIIYNVINAKNGNTNGA